MDILVGIICVVAFLAVCFGIGYLCAQSPGWSALALLLSLLGGE